MADTKLQLALDFPLCTENSVAIYQKIIKICRKMKGFKFEKNFRYINF